MTGVTTSKKADKLYHIAWVYFPWNFLLFSIYLNSICSGDSLWANNSRQTPKSNKVRINNLPTTCHRLNSIFAYTFLRTCNKSTGLGHKKAYRLHVFRVVSLTNSATSLRFITLQDPSNPAMQWFYVCSISSKQTSSRAKGFDRQKALRLCRRTFIFELSDEAVRDIALAASRKFNVSFAEHKVRYTVEPLLSSHPRGNGKWLLNRGWAFNRWPLNMGSTVDCIYWTF